MGKFNDTKQAIVDSFTKINENRNWRFKVISFDTTDGENCLCLGGRDEDTDAEIKFYGVGYMSLPIIVPSMELSLAHWEDAQPIQWSLGQDAPPWIVCFKASREGGSPAKYFVAAARIEITSSGTKVLETQPV
jgi:hypothetical protein